MTYGDRLSEALEHAKKSRAELSRGIGLSVQAIGQVINGDTKALTAENNALAAEFLRVSSYWLATGNGEMVGKADQVPGYSTEALALGWLLDQIPNRLDKTVANNSATAAILEVLQRSGAAPTHKPVQSATQAKQTS